MASCTFKTLLNVDSECSIQKCKDYYKKLLKGIKTKKGKSKVSVFVNRLVDRPYEALLTVKDSDTLTLRVPSAFVDSMKLYQCGVVLSGVFITVPSTCIVITDQATDDAPIIVSPFALDTHNAGEFGVVIAKLRDLNDAEKQDSHLSIDLKIKLIMVDRTAMSTHTKPADAPKVAKELRPVHMGCRRDLSTFDRNLWKISNCKTLDKIPSGVLPFSRQRSILNGDQFIGNNYYRKTPSANSLSLNGFIPKVIVGNFELVQRDFKGIGDFGGIDRGNPNYDEYKKLLRTHPRPPMDDIRKKMMETRCLEELESGTCQKRKLDVKAVLAEDDGLDGESAAKRVKIEQSVV
ncbi:Orf97 [Heliothis zea nudivirus]|uniref:Orf97 n=1 Tax=Heliothis zea nudivirus 1 TaxID=3116536 RepID=Q8JKL6_9VIRU|nr:Orf97 [Heliothis zea nudivirus]AAN04391.1 Orf97 [Heliothis zea nudivirus]